MPIHWPLPKRWHKPLLKQSSKDIITTTSSLNISDASLHSLIVVTNCVSNLTRELSRTGRIQSSRHSHTNCRIWSVKSSTRTGWTINRYSPQDYKAEREVQTTSARWSWESPKDLCSWTEAMIWVACIPTNSDRLSRCQRLRRHYPRAGRSSRPTALVRALHRPLHRFRRLRTKTLLRHQPPQFPSKTLWLPIMWSPSKILSSLWLHRPILSRIRLFNRAVSNSSPSSRCPRL